MATDYCGKDSVLDALREGFKVNALADAMRAVNVSPRDGAQAIDEMRDAGAEIVGNVKKAAGGGEKTASHCLPTLMLAIVFSPFRFLLRTPTCWFLRLSPSY